MNSTKIVWQETGIVAAGVLVCTALMIGVFALVGKFDISVLLGGAVGALLAVGNFFFMAVGITLAADKAENQEVNAGKLLARNSYLLRLLVLGVLLFACAKSGIFNLLALALPLTFVRPALTIAEFFRKTGGNSL
jgi:hypothetical protein